jgi:hypothetical protein
MTDTDQTQTPAAGRVTIDDVRSALEGIDPNTTNASKVRGLLGNRGSFETIQKHLSVLRQELATAAAPPVPADQVPALPADAAQAMWVAAWNAAQVATLRRTEKLANERDVALLKLETMGQDVVGFVATIDDQSGQLDQAEADALAVDAAHLAGWDKVVIEQVAAEAERAKLAKNLESTLQELAQEKANASHAAELAESGRVMMREELQRLTDQVGELKAHLYKRAETAPLTQTTPFPAG